MRDYFFFEVHILEECPKWKVLSEVLEEIEKDDKDFQKGGEPGKIVVAAQDERTCSQIKEVCETYWTTG